MFLCVYRSNPQSVFDETLLSRITTDFKSLKAGAYSQNRSNNFIILSHNEFCKTVRTPDYGFSWTAGYTEKPNCGALTEKKLNTTEGQFLLGSFDLNTNKLLLATDPLGIYPAFSIQHNGLIFISTHFEILLKILKRKTPNAEAINDYLRSGFTLNRTTLIQELNYLDGGSLYEFTEKQIKKEKYFNENQIKSEIFSLKQASECFHETLKSITQNLITQHQVENCFLTGGSDSRILLSCLTKEQLKDFVFTCYLQPAWSSHNRDAEVVHYLSKRYNLKTNFVTQTDKEVLSLKSFFENKCDFPILTGTSGSELMGSVVYTNAPFKKNEFLKEKFGKSYFKDASLLCFNSFFTTLYVRYRAISFVAPYMKHFKNLSMPFTDSRLLKLIYSFPEKYMMGYHIYSELFQNSLSDFAQTPFNSNICNFNKTLPKLIELNETKASFRHPAADEFDLRLDDLTKWFDEFADLEITKEEIRLLAS